MNLPAYEPAGTDQITGDRSRPEDVVPPDAWLDTLIDAYFEGDIAESDREALSRELRTSPAARQAFWEAAQLQMALRGWAGDAWGRLAAAADAGEASRLGVGRDDGRVGQADHGGDPARPQPRLAAALAAALTIAGLVAGAGAAWAMAPQLWGPSRLAVALANPSFEVESAGVGAAGPGVERLESLPETFKQWLSDHVRVCGAEQGVMPAHGQRMVAFEQALPGPGPAAGDRADSCDMFQLIDLTPYREAIAAGECGLTATVKVLDAGPPRQQGSSFSIKLHVYDQEPASILARWPAVRFDAPAIAHERWLSNGATGTPQWQELSAGVLLPKRAVFAVLQIDATSLDRSTGRPTATFDRHYCDDVRLTISIPAATK